MVGVLNLFLDPELSYIWRERHQWSLWRHRDMNWPACIASGHGCLTLSENGHFHSIPIYIAGRQFLKIKKFYKRFNGSCLRKPRVASSKHRMSVRLLQLRWSRSYLLGWGLTSPAFHSQQHSGGLQGWIGTTAGWKTKYILTATSETMSWPIDACLWAKYKANFQFWDDNGNPLPLSCPSNLHHLILVIYNESTFFQNNEQKTC